MSGKSDFIITQLKVKNFRSLADVDISLEPLTVFVGPNGAGKSNIVDSLRFVRDALIRGLDNSILERHGMSAMRRWSAKGRPFDVTIHLSIQGKNFFGEYGFTLGSERRGEYRVKWEKCSVTYKDRSEGYEYRSGEWIQPPTLIDRHERKPPPHLKTALYLSTPFPMMEGQYRLRRVLQDMGFYTIYPDTLREPQKPANPRPLDEKGQNLAAVLRDLKKRKRSNVQTMVEALGKVTTGIRDFSVSQVGGYLVTRLHYGTGGPAFELAQESDGTLRVLGILSALYQTPPRSLIAVEEPELTIHPGALGVLCDVLQETSSRSQVVITTHSPDLIYHFPVEYLRVVEKVDGSTEVGPVAGHQRQAITAKLFSPGELMRMEGLQRETN